MYDKERNTGTHGTDMEMESGATKKKKLLYMLALWGLVILLFAGLISCASGSNEGVVADTAQVQGRGSEAKPFRLLLGRSQATDSVLVASEFFVDQSFRRAIDSIPQAEFITLNVRDSLLAQAQSVGKEGLEFAELGAKLNLDGIIFTNVARFGSVLGINTRIVDPKTNEELFQDLSFSFIRFRDENGDMLIGPPLYDAVRKSVSRFFRVPHTTTAPVAGIPVVISGIIIPKELALGRIANLREEISTEGVRALGDYARLHFPELIVFDYEGREQVYATVGVMLVENYMPMNDLERHALYSIGIDHYISATIELAGKDSVELGVEIRYVRSPRSDTLVERASARYPVLKFETSTTTEDVVVEIINVAEGALKNEAERVRERYEIYRKGTQ